MAVISLKLSESLDAQLTEQAQRRRLSKSELVRRALTAFLQSSEQGLEGTAPQSAVDLLADLVGCCEGAPADLSANPAYLAEFGANGSPDQQQSSAQQECFRTHKSKCHAVTAFCGLIR